MYKFRDRIITDKNREDCELEMFSRIIHADNLEKCRVFKFKERHVTKKELVVIGNAFCKLLRAKQTKRKN